MTARFVKRAVVGTTKNDDAHHVLLEAGIGAMQRRAAYLPQRTEAALPELAPDDAIPPCDAQAALQLAWLLSHRQMRLQEIWVKKLVKLNMGLPYHWIVPILQYGDGSRFSSYYELVGLIGERGKWIAKQQDRWSWVFKQAKTSKQRASDEADIGIKSLQEIRRRNPDEGRDWLIRYWDELRNDGNRWQYLELLRFGLSKSDEIWLMNIAAGLKDGATDSVPEAQIALQLLSLLPKQALIEDLCQKVFSTVQLNPDESPMLDFIWSVSYEGQLVYKAHIGLTNLMNIFDWRLPLDAILELIPIRAWIEHFKLGSAELFKAAMTSTHMGVLSDGWGKRILYEQDTEFALVWLGQFANLEELGQAKNPFKDIESLAYELFEMLSWHELVEVLKRYVQDLQTVEDDEDEE